MADVRREPFAGVIRQASGSVPSSPPRTQSVGRITPTALSAAAALPADSGAALTPTLSLKREGILRTSVEFAVSNAADEPEP